MRLQLSAPPGHLLNADIQITGSKSESNRLLLLRALYPNISIENLSNSDDSRFMQKGLSKRDGLVDIHHAGTAMRFLTAYFACQKGAEVILTGSERMKQRPIKVLVEALHKLGAEIEYVEKDGFPPIRIRGRHLSKTKTSLPANISSQYISALLLIAPSLDNGLELSLEGDITSVPYIKMTCALLSELGIENTFNSNRIRVSGRKSIAKKTIVVESDWSSASYIYSIVALAAEGSQIRLSSYKEDSLQGDRILSEIYQEFGVETRFEDHCMVLRKKHLHSFSKFTYDLANAPDLAQTIAVNCFGLGVACDLTGLHTLKIKETDRLLALKTELTKLGAEISVTDNRLMLNAGDFIKQNVAIDTYNDHRMAMAFAPLALRTQLSINDAEVVSKSYPGFWEDLKLLGITASET
ncbi:MAG: 3-phosphoshikimate 1-carboxyvinyltransferase [Flavobacteriaceae bacterium]